MSWTITPTQLRVDDQDALTYLAAVETADGQALESGVRLAVNAFVKGCKADGIWPSIKASCILAGARTLQGALVPLVGAAPTSFNFVAGDYNRKTGLIGDGSTKTLNTNRAETADGQNNHVSAYVTTLSTGVILANDPFSTSLSATAHRNRNTTSTSYAPSAGFIGSTRSNSASYEIRSGLATTSVTQAFNTNSSTNLFLFSFRLPQIGDVLGTHRIAFYSIGGSLNLTQLDSRVTTLINAIAAAIP